MERAREQLSDRFPGLKDDSVFDQVSKKLEILAKTGAYADVAPTVQKRILVCMEDACRLAKVEATGDAEAERRRTKEVSQTRSNGQPITSSRRTPGKTKNQDERLREAFDVGEAGGSDDDMRKALRG